VKLDALPLYADRGYESRSNCTVCDRASLKDRIFRRRTKTTRRENAKRVVVEHTFAWLQRYRRLVHFYEQTPQAFRAFVLFALFACGHLLGRRL
jgi:hypothetical protein